MRTMPAVRLHAVGTRPQVDQVDVPEAGPDQVRVRVRACGLCGSDVHLVHGVTPTGPLPLILGHESAGVVDTVGERVTDWKAGDRVSVAAGYGCGECAACGRGAENQCARITIPGIDVDGAQATYVVVPGRSLIALSDSVDFSVGAILTDAVATPFHAIRRAGVQAGDTVAVFGLGGLGLHAVSILRQVVGARVIGVDVNQAVLDRAVKFGADEVVDASDGRPARALRAAGGVQHSFEFVGDPAVADQAVKALAPGGTCTIVGLTPAPLQLLPQALLVSSELRVQGAFGCTRDELVELVGLVADGRLDLNGTITHRFPLESFDEALRILETKEGDPIRVVVEQPA